MKRLLAGLLCLLTVSGCTGGTPVPPAGEPDAGELRLMTVSTFGGTDASTDTYQDLIQQFQRKYPDLRVQDESAAADESWKAKVTADFAAGNEPHVLFFFTGSDARGIIAHQKVVPVDTVRGRYPEYGQFLKPYATEYMTEFDGKQYALPVRGFWEGLYCNTDLFQEHGVELPKTWNQFLAAIDAFSSEGVTPIAASLSDVPHYLIENLILSAGGISDHRFVPDPAGGAEQYPESWVRGLEAFRLLKERGAFAEDAPVISFSASEQIFREKEAAMMVNGSWMAGGITDQESTTVLPIPPMPGSGMRPGEIIHGYSMGFYITAKAWEDPDLREPAVRFVEEMTSMEAISRFAEVAGGPAADVQPSMVQTPLALAGQALVENAPAADMPIDSRMSKAAWELLYSSVPGIAEGREDPSDILGQAAALN